MITMYALMEYPNKRGKDGLGWGGWVVVGTI